MRHGIRQLGADSVVLVLLLLQCICLPCLAQLAASQNTAGAEFVSYPRAATAATKLSVQVRQTPALPKWCKVQDESLRGAWHTLSDDEYSNESPYLRCALQQTLTPQSASQRRAASIREEQLPSSCAAALSVPKVAMMFLTQGAMPHEALWEKWLGSISGLIPTLCTANAVCARGGFQVLSSLASACRGRKLAGQSTYDRQMLYSVYIHAQPGYPLRNKSSVFYGRDSQVARLHTRWGDHSTVEVTRRLLQTALRDPDNQRFILLSESCIPLYSPLIVYQQLMHEGRSRISACSLPGWERSIERYNVRMAAGVQERGRIPIQKWRKHMHWTSLLRTHAELIANDTEIVDTFARDCFTGFDILSAEPGNYRFCIGDEHYISTLLAMYGLDSQTDCMGKLTNAAFSRDTEHPEHPKAYSAFEINATMFSALRSSGKEAIDATNFANQAFRRIEDYDEDDSTWQLPYPDLKQLKPQFYLFARKFPEQTAATILAILSENDDKGMQLNVFGGLHRLGMLPQLQYGQAQ